MTDIPCSDALSLADGFRHGHWTPSDIVEAALSSATRAPYAFIEYLTERARREAAASTQRWHAGQPLSPLDGVPMAWKDLFDVAGHVTTAGADLRRSATPASSDAELVRLAASAGMICLGKTNLSEFAYSGLGLNPHFGTPVLPGTHMPSRVPGGSSSGSGVAVAAGVVPLAMGTDTAGSVRIPAAFNGLVGYRPSPDRYSRDGIFPLSSTLDCAGPLARSVRDLCCLDTVLSDGEAPAPPASLDSVHLVVDTRVLEDPQIESAVAANLRELVMRLECAGARVEWREYTVFGETLDHIARDGWLGSLEAFLLHQLLLDSHDAERLDPRVRCRLEASRPVDRAHLASLLARRDALQQAQAETLGDAILVTPTVAHVAPELAPLTEDAALFAEVNAATLRLTMPGSLLGMAGITLPSGVDRAGLATAALFATRRGEDTRLLETMAAVERTLTTV